MFLNIHNLVLVRCSGSQGNRKKTTSIYHQALLDRWVYGEFRCIQRSMCARQNLCPCFAFLPSDLLSPLRDPSQIKDYVYQCENLRDFCLRITNGRPHSPLSKPLQDGPHNIYFIHQERYDRNISSIVKFPLRCAYFLALSSLRDSEGDIPEALQSIISVTKLENI